MPTLTRSGVEDFGGCGYPHPPVPSVSSYVRNAVYLAEDSIRRIAS